MPVILTFSLLLRPVSGLTAIPGLFFLAAVAADAELARGLIATHAMAAVAAAGRLFRVDIRIVLLGRLSRACDAHARGRHLCRES